MLLFQRQALGLQLRHIITVGDLPYIFSESTFSHHDFDPPNINFHEIHPFGLQKCAQLPFHLPQATSVHRTSLSCQVQQKHHIFQNPSNFHGRFGKPVAIYSNIVLLFTINILLQKKMQVFVKPMALYNRLYSYGIGTTKIIKHACQIHVSCD